MLSLLLLFGVLLFLVCMGVPVFLSMAGAAVTYALVTGTVPSMILAQSLVQGVNSYIFVAIPFFFLAGEIISRAGIGARLFKFAGTLVGHRQGGLSHVNVLTNVSFAGVSGSAVADAAAISGIITPAMREAGYPAPYACAITAAGATIGPILPPSIPMLIYALFTGASVTQLFMSGIVPAFLMAGGLIVLGAFIASRRGFPTGPRASWGDVRTAAVSASLGLAMPVIVVAGLRLGLATATEIGALLVLYASIIGLFFYRSVGVSDLWQCLVEAARASAGLLVIVASAGSFVWILATAGLGQAVADFIVAQDLNAQLLLLLVVLLTLILGMMLDPITILVLLGPLLLPTVTAVGIDVVHFGVVLILSTVIGLLTPPVGVILYLVSAQAGVSPVAVMREMAPMLAVLISVLLLVALFPLFSVGFAQWVIG
ncbi:TRAP transporter large permease [Lentibacter algarum]|uniref:TRAP transporter large permease n=1 Tax=Lentibacter algarum TaxID=576131 RepID=UPI001C098278|nr:TRAP transporter large permease [Lentibacter algarum]MBU2982819.1 TRAP transporter large permease [Lentibacter algarum]